MTTYEPIVYRRTFDFRIFNLGPSDFTINEGEVFLKKQIAKASMLCNGAMSAVKALKTTQDRPPHCTSHTVSHSVQTCLTRGV